MNLKNILSLFGLVPTILGIVMGAYNKVKGLVTKATEEEKSD